MAVGMFDTIYSVASQPTGVWDIVPADLVASSILAAAAAVSAGTAAAISQATQSGVVKGAEEDCRVVLGYPHPFAVSARHTALARSQGSQGDIAYITTKILNKAGAADGTAGMADSPDAHPQRDQHCSNHPVSSDTDSPRLFTGTAPNCSTDCGRSSSMCDSDSQQLRQHQHHHGSMPLLVVHSATSSTYPLVLMESWNYMLDFLEAHAPPFR